MRDTLKEHLTRISRKGGSSKSPRKLAAANENLRRAMAKRFPHDPRWSTDRPIVDITPAIRKIDKRIAELQQSDPRWQTKEPTT